MSASEIGKASGQNDRFIEGFVAKVFVFMCAENRKNPASLSSPLLKALVVVYDKTGNVI